MELNFTQPATQLNLNTVQSISKLAQKNSAFTSTNTPMDLKRSYKRKKWAQEHSQLSTGTHNKNNNG